MRDDEDALAGYDLSAWEAPPPPASLVDGVIARAKESAMPSLVEERPQVVVAPARPRTRWWLAGSVAAAACAVAAIGFWGLERAGTEPAAAPAGGTRVTPRAQTLSLGASSAIVDPHAEVNWVRQGERLVAEQRRGSVVWQVGSADMLVLDAGAMAALVEASGARLRVEVNMNERVIAGSAAVTAAAALVTVLVYEGTARVSHRGHSVIVVAGERYEVPPALDGEDLAVGASVDIERLQDELARRTAELDHKRELQRKLEEELRVVKPASCDEVECVLTNYEGACCAKYKKPLAADSDAKPTPPSPKSAGCDEMSCVLGDGNSACCAKYKKAASPPPADAMPDALDRQTIMQAVDAVRAQMEDCGADFEGTMTLKATVAPSGELTSTKVVGPKGEDEPKAIAACMHAAALNMSFPRTKSGGAFNYPFRFKTKPPADPAGKAAPTKVAENAGCDQLEFLLEKGNALANHGMWNKALEKFEEALRCKDTEVTRKRAFAAACHAKLAPAASRHYANLPAAARTQLLPVCQRNGVDPTKPVIACDTPALVARAEALMKINMDEEALAKLEEALACKHDNNARRLAVFAACRAKDAVKARKYAASLPKGPSDVPSSIGQICIRNGISLDPSDYAPAPTTGTFTVRTKPVAKVSVDGVFIGETPLTTPLSPGRHKVTLTTADKTSTYTVDIQAGRTESWTKDLQ